ncbi:MAG: sulfonate ABC transporter substrate-binding protein [Actinobacteria bacterium RBG_16_70_17]|nr:MAG: sulfonate ABC transporter substrate-binding protein [Actinobacteria bacterium RBG_16_70_17]
MTRSLRRPLALLALLAALAAACGGDETAGEATTLRLGCFPNVTHAPALVGIQEGFFAEALGSDVELELSYFNAGPEAVESLFGEALDATFIGPNPAINAYAQSDGEAIRIIAGSTSGGAFLVVRPGIESVEDLAGTTLATPQLGNTQDVALRAWLIEQGLSADTAGGGDVSIVPQSNADTLRAFQAGDIDGAWVPEPWATRLIQEGGGTILIDERDLWPDGLYVTTHLIVRTEFLEQNPTLIKQLLEGYLEALRFVNENPAEAQTVTNDAIEAITGARLPDQVIAGAWENLTFTWDPIASSLQESADDAVEVDLLDPVDLSGIYALEILNGLLANLGETPVEGL